ncbi:hypothetical protein LMG24235_02700 [Paraburkholderia sabiae]|nr:hypothetical protein LMG24235_02700 [Paraburkholderia sabiae]
MEHRVDKRKCAVVKTLTPDKVIFEVIYQQIMPMDACAAQCLGHPRMFDVSRNVRQLLAEGENLRERMPDTKQVELMFVRVTRIRCFDPDGRGIPELYADIECIRQHVCGK